MQVLSKHESGDGYTRLYPVEEMNTGTIREAKAVFQKYKREGTIADGEFESMIWSLTDETKTRGFIFEIDKTKFMPWLGCTPECYTECVKAFLLYQLGILSIATLYEILRALRSLAVTKADQVTVQCVGGNYLAPLLSLLPGESMIRDEVIDDLENQSFQLLARKNPRVLSTLADYMNFNERLNAFWISAGSAEKLRFFPIYLWWTLTTILPLRPTEFLLLPYDCLKSSNGKNILTIRRTRQKKGLYRVHYHIEEDYDLMMYEVSAGIAEQIIWYKETTRNTGRSMDTLFALPDTPVSSSKYFNYALARKWLYYFCRDVLGQPDYPIHLGDTRHLAMISLILSGGSPVICRELAGHESIDISSNYYANLSAIIDSSVYQWCHSRKNGARLFGSLQYPLQRKRKGSRVAAGWCEVSGIVEGNIAECLKNYNEYGHIGECASCRHFIADTPSLTVKIEAACKDAVDSDMAFLIQMIRQIRRGNGYTEDIQAAILRLQHSAQKYGELLTDKYTEE